MMTKFKEIRHAFKNRQDPECARAIADAIWYTTLAVALVVFVLSMLYSGWLLYRVVYGVEREESGAVAADSISREELQAALDALEAERARYRALLADPPRIVDPS